MSTIARRNAASAALQDTLRELVDFLTRHDQSTPALRALREIRALEIAIEDPIYDTRAGMLAGVECVQRELVALVCEDPENGAGPYVLKAFQSAAEHIRAEDFEAESVAVQ